MPKRAASPDFETIGKRVAKRRRPALEELQEDREQVSVVDADEVMPDAVGTDEDFGDERTNRLDRIHHTCDGKVVQNYVQPTVEDDTDTFASKAANLYQGVKQYAPFASSPLRVSSTPPVEDASTTPRGAASPPHHDAGTSHATTRNWTHTTTFTARNYGSEYQPTRDAHVQDRHDETTEAFSKRTPNSAHGAHQFGKMPGILKEMGRNINRGLAEADEAFDNVRGEFDRVRKAFGGAAT